MREEDKYFQDFNEEKIASYIDRSVDFFISRNDDVELITVTSIDFNFADMAYAEQRGICSVDYDDGYSIELKRNDIILVPIMIYTPKELTAVLSEIYRDYDVRYLKDQQPDENIADVIINDLFEHYDFTDKEILRITEENIILAVEMLNW